MNTDLKNASAPWFPAKRLAALLSHAAQSVQHYRRLLPEMRGIETIDYATFARLPHLRKSDIQADPTLRQFLSEKTPSDRVIYDRTSGSTGRPLLCAKSREERLQMSWTSWRVRGWWDRAIRGKPAAAILPTARTQTERHKGELRFSVNNVSEKTLEYYYKRLVAFKPQWMYGISSAIYHLAVNLQSKLQKNQRLKLSLIELAGEFSPPAYHETIRQAFGCNVSLHYGCAEMWLLAYSCPNGSLHVIEDDVFLEILDTSGQPVPIGQVGQVVATSLRLRTMPFIRYELGDRARFVPGQCDCGRQWRRLELTGSRESHAFETPDGRRFDGRFFWRALEVKLGAINQRSSSPGLPLSSVIKSYQIVQKAHNLFHFYYEPGDQFGFCGTELFKDLEYQSKLGIGPSVDVRFDLIPGGRRVGKYNFFVSELVKSK